MELVINFSGGKDSTAMLALLCERYPHVPKHVVMADTGWEHVDSPGKWPSAIVWSEMIVERFGLPLHVVRNPNKTLLEMAARRGKFPGMSQRQCTSDLKRDPIHTWIRRRYPSMGARDPHHVVISCMGLRAEESIGRSRLPKLRRNARLQMNNRTVWDWNPILRWTEAEVRAYLAERRIPLHPVYQHLRRFSCRVCIFMTDHDLRQVKQHDPEAIETISRIEEQIGFTMFQRGPIKTLT